MHICSYIVHVALFVKERNKSVVTVCRLSIVICATFVPFLKILYFPNVPIIPVVPVPEIPGMSNTRLNQNNDNKNVRLC